MKYLSKSPRETGKLAKLLAAEVLKTKPGKNTLVLALSGELGAGKTTFTRSFVKGLGIKSKILSPTFVIMKSFHLKSHRFSKVYHIDCYRIPEREMVSLGLKKILKEPAIVIIEWADKLKRIIPKGAIWITFHHGRHHNERHLTFNRR